MRNLLRQEMVGDYQLSLIEVVHPTMPQLRGIDFEVRRRLPAGKLSGPIGDSSQGFHSEQDGWNAGFAFIARLEQKPA
jgi:hypothetical protein